MVIDMNKSQLVEITAHMTNISSKDTEAVINTAFDLIVKSLAENDRVSITGFGSFMVRNCKARQGVDPRTGEKIIIPEHNLPKFCVSDKLKKAVNN